MNGGGSRGPELNQPIVEVDRRDGNKDMLRVPRVGRVALGLGRGGRTERTRRRQCNRATHKRQGKTRGERKKPPPRRKPSVGLFSAMSADPRPLWLLHHMAQA